jgi:hypothetical protein
MAKNLKKLLIEKLGPFFAVRGFIYDKSVSKNGGYIFSRGESEPSVQWWEDWYEEFRKGNTVHLPHRETIMITQHRFMPTMTADLSSLQKKERSNNLGRIAGITTNVQKWWLIRGEQEIVQACGEILELMDRRGWAWFMEKE